MTGIAPVRVLVVDDSPLAQGLLREGLALDPGIEVVGVAVDPYEARDKIARQRPDVLTLDVEMPRMNGIDFLLRLMPQFPLPVVMVSGVSERGRDLALQALEAGAVDFVSKPGRTSSGFQEMLSELRTKIKVAATANVAHWKGRWRPGTCVWRETKRLERYADRVVAIGASTGGTDAIRFILSRLPQSCPGIVIVQHMPAGFTRLFAERLNAKCALAVREARDGDAVEPGLVLIAPGGLQTRVLRSEGGYRVQCQGVEPVRGHCPSVEILMESVGQAAGPKGIGAILTGMGGDGATGLLALRRAGGRTFVQDEASCVVYGMPKVAWELGAAERRVPLETVPEALFELLAE